MPSSACSGQCCPGRSGRGAKAARAPSSPLAASAAPWSQQGPSSASAGDQGGLGRGRGHRRLRGGSGRSDASQPRSGPPSHSPRRTASCTRHGLTARPVNRTCQGVGTGVRWGDRGTGAAGPAWLVVREPRGRPAEAIPRTTRPRSRTRRRPRALFWVESTVFSYSAARPFGTHISAGTESGGSACWGAHFSSGACPPHFVYRGSCTSRTSSDPAAAPAFRCLVRSAGSRRPASSTSALRVSGTSHRLARAAEPIVPLTTIDREHGSRASPKQTQVRPKI